MSAPLVFGGEGGGWGYSCRAWRVVEIPGKWLLPGRGQCGPVERPWGVATLGGPGWGEKAMGREAGFSFKGGHAWVLGRGTGAGDSLGRGEELCRGSGWQRKAVQLSLALLLGSCLKRLVELMS